MNIEKKPLYILAAAPYEPSKLKLFESGSGSISDLLLREGGIRYSGWDLSTGERPKIIKGEYLETKIDEVKKINLYEDGRLVCWVAADPNFLAWPSKEEEFLRKPRLNPLAVIEITYNFVNVYKNLIQYFITTPQKIRFVIQLKNAFLNHDAKLYLVPGGLNSIEWLTDRSRYPAPESDMDKNVDVDINALKEEKAHVAYLLIEKLYLWLGMDIDCIPYVSKNDKGESIIDIDKIRSKK